jgi:hypothetical protein
MDTTNHASMFEIVLENGKCVRKEVKEYSDPAFTTAAGITSILNDVKAFAPGYTYSMVVGGHGLGWIPVDAPGRANAIKHQPAHWEYGTADDKDMTRFFGGLDKESQTDITTLAEGISGAGIKMEYILFDDCYMSCVEAAYDLRHVADYIIGCPTEIMVYGMPYHIIGQHLIGDIDYRAISDDFIDFYTTAPNVKNCGTIGITDTSQIDELAAIMKTINSQFSFDESFGDLQTMCGYTPSIFFDCGSYVETLCKDEALLQRFREQLERTVPYKGHTATYYTNISRREIPINSYSGTTISDPSHNDWAEDSKHTTAWWQATH